MARRYRRHGTASSRRRTRIVEKDEALAGRVAIELPVVAADVIRGVSDEIERLAGEAGLRIMQAVMQAEVESLAGPKGRHESERPMTRWGQQGGYIVLAGKKVRLKRPRVRNEDGGEVALESYGRFQSPPRRQQSIYRPLIRGISTRKYAPAIEAFTDGYGISKSAVSREFIEATSGELETLCERRIDTLGPLAALMIDGQHFAGECLVAALGVDATGRKHVLGLAQGATENAVVVQQLLDDLVRRGLDPKRPMLIVIDGGKALRKAVQQTFGERCPVQRCQLHKRRNVVELLAEEHQGSAQQRLRAAYVTAGHAEARRQLLATVAWLEKINPTAAASLREGLEETLTLHRLGVPAELRRSLCSTNLIESALSVTRDLTRRVKRWRDGDMRQRWAAAGLLTVEQRFRRVRGHKWMSTLMKILQNRRAAVATKAQAA